MSDLTQLIGSFFHRNQLYPTNVFDYSTADESAEGVSMTDVETWVGAEFEVENIPVCWAKFRGGNYLRLIEDGSLRNNGGEFITVPLQKDSIRHVISRYCNALKKFSPTREFTHRTSTHIHANVRDLSFKHLTLLVAIYIIYEDVFFRYTQSHRHYNPFCTSVSSYMSDISTLVFVDQERKIRKHKFNINNWPKYSALNLRPVTDPNKGTIEFRHLHGTDDLDEILEWIRMIDSLVTFVRNVKTDDDYKRVYEDIIGLNTNSAYTEFTSNVFSKSRRVSTLSFKEIKECINHKITLAKLLLLVGITA